MKKQGKMTPSKLTNSIVINSDSEVNEISEEFFKKLLVSRS
jgi:hypothetical protein